ncbi:hypothetical protein CFBP6626_24030 (plasmid) [Agrobacterium tumefaciens]|nr:hypothetical protein CFBP6626_24030 [Agrobacterium tumefaciens]CUX64875.1 conserved exported hypothetical protein [Agrobacterium genomosp. 5 str. CFBP 6626]
MKLSQVASACSVAALMAFASFGAVSAADLSTPEGTVAAYIEGVAQQDFDAVLATTSVEKASQGYDLVAAVSRLRALTSRMPAPSSSPFLVAINKADFTAQIASQLKFLTYGLMTKSELIEGKTVQMEGEGATDFVSVVRADRLESLELVKVDIPKPSLLNGERNQVNAVKMAATYGADMLTERVALVSFEGLNFAIGFTLLRYGEEWFVLYQNSNIAGLSPLGVPQPVTPDEYEKLLQ